MQEGLNVLGNYRNLLLQRQGFNAIVFSGELVPFLALIVASLSLSCRITAMSKVFRIQCADFDTLPESMPGWWCISFFFIMKKNFCVGRIIKMLMRRRICNIIDAIPCKLIILKHHFLRPRKFAKLDPSTQHGNLWGYVRPGSFLIDLFPVAVVL